MKLEKKIQNDDDNSLKEEDLIIVEEKFNYGAGVNNPIDNVSFFSKKKENKAFKLKREQVSKNINISSIDHVLTQKILIYFFKGLYNAAK